MNDLQIKTDGDAMQSGDPEMSLIDAIYQRRSVRGYLDKEVPQASLNRIFEIANQSPSNCNVQPWKAYVASGKLKDRLKAEMVERTSTGGRAESRLSLPW